MEKATAALEFFSTRQWQWDTNNMEELEKRLRGRNTETEESIQVFKITLFFYNNLVFQLQLFLENNCSVALNLTIPYSLFILIIPILK